jgi:hypothetical protein
MANTAVGTITIVYHGQTQQFTTVSQATHFLRRDNIKVGWFHQVKAGVQLILDGDVKQVKHLKGKKYHVIEALEQLERDARESRA